MGESSGLERFGVDVSVKNFDSFKSNMDRVEELMGRFSKSVPEFARSAGVFSRGIDKIGTAITKQSVKSVDDLAEAYERLTKSIPSKIPAPRAATTKAAKAATGADNSAAAQKIQDRIDKQSISLAERQAQVVQKIQQRQNDRRLADEASFARSAARIAEETARAKTKISNDLSRAQAQQAKDQAAKQRVDTDFGNVALSIRKSLDQAQAGLQGKLADALLNRKEEADIKSRISNIFGDLQTKFAQIQRGNSNAANILNLKQLQKEIREVTAATEQQIAAQKKLTAGGPSIAFLARERQRDQISGLTAQQFAIGKIAEAARSANPVIRTFARTMFAVEDAAAAAKLGTEAFRIILGKIIGTLAAISAPVRLLIGLFRLFGVTTEGLASKLGFLFGRTAFKGAEGIARMNQEASALRGTFKNLDLSAFEKFSSGSAKKAKETQDQFRQLNFELAKFNPEDVTFGPSPLSRLFGGQKKAQEAAVAQARDGVQKLVVIEQQATQQIAAVEKAREAIQSQIAEAAAQKQTRATQDKVAKLIDLETKANQQLAALEKTRTGAATGAERLKPIAAGGPLPTGKAPLGIDSAADAMHRLGVEASGAQAPTSGLQSILSIFAGSAVGGAVVAILGKIVAGFREVAATVAQSVIQFEMAEVSFTTLSKREIVDANPMIGFAKAEELASARAQELIGWSEQLAIISPFEQDDINKILRTGLAYDFTTQEAQTLTDILVDFASGSGQSAEAANGVALALGQIQAAGKVSGQEIRQLVNNGVPALRILSEATGKSVEELKEFTDKGGVIEGKGAVTAIAKALGEEFNGAAERSSRTLQGLISSLGDLKKIGLREVFMPLIQDVIEPFGAQIVEFLQQPAFREGLRSIGEGISEFVQQVIESTAFLYGIFSGIGEAAWMGITAVTSAIGSGITALAAISPAVASVVEFWSGGWTSIQNIAQQAVNAITSYIASLWQQALPYVQAGIENLVGFFTGGFDNAQRVVLEASQNIATYFSELLTQMVDYGSNIVNVFAEGIVASASAVVDALSYLGSIITSWLEPGSPPRLLPDLTKWGTGAADAWLEGWTDADFGLFDDLSSSVEKALSAASGGMVDPEDIAAVRKQVAAAVGEFDQSGAISPEAIGRIASAAGGYADEIGRIAKAYVDSAVATEKANQAQLALDNATKKYAELLAPIDDQLAKINGLQTAEDESDQIRKLENVLANRFATEAQKRRAQLQLQKLGLEQQKRGLETERDGVLDNLQASKAKADEEQKAAQEALAITQKRFDIQFGLIGALNKEASAAGDLADKLGKAKKEKEELGKLSFKDIGGLGDLKFEAPDIAGKLEPALQRAKDAIDRGKGLVMGAVDAFNKGLAGLAVGGEVVTDAEGNPVVRQVNQFEEAVNKLGLLINNVRGKTDALKAEFDRLRAIFAQGFGGSTESGGKGEEQTQLTGLDAFVQEAGALSGKLKTTFDSIVGVVTSFATTFATEWDKAGKSDDGKTSLVDRFFATINSTPVQGQLETIKTNIVTEINGLFGSEETTTFDWPAISSRIKATLDKIVPDPSVLRQNVISAIDKMFGAGTGEGAVNAVTTKVQAGLDLLFGDVTFTDLTSSFESFKTSVTEAISGIDWTSLSVDGSTILKGLKDAAISAVQGIFSGFDKLLSGDVSGAGKDIVGGLAGAGEGLGNALEGVGGLAQTLLEGIDFAKTSASIGAAISTAIVGLLSGAVNLAIGGLKALGGTGEEDISGGTTGGLAETITASLVETLLGFVTGVLAGAFNLLTLDNIKAALLAVVDIAQTLGGILLGIILGIFKGGFAFVDTIAENSEMVKQITETRDKILAYGGTIVEGMTGAITAMSDKVSAFVTGDLETKKGIISGAVTSILSSMVSGPVSLGEALGLFKEGTLATTIETIATTVDTIIDAVTNPVQAISDAFTAIKEKLQSFVDFEINLGFTKIKLGGSDAAEQTKLPVAAEVTSLDTSSLEGEDKAPTVNVKATTDPTAAAQVGKDIQSGVESGITEQQKEDKSQQSWSDYFKSFWETGSPSEKSKREVGIPIGQGIVLGIQEILDAAVLDYSKLLGGTSTDGAGSTGGIQLKIAATIGAINLSSTDEFKKSLGNQVAAIFNDMSWEDDITADLWKNLTGQTATSLGDINWEQDLQPDTWYDTLTPWVEETMRKIEWQNFIFPATWAPMARVVESTMRGISWANYIKTTTWDSLARRIRETLEDIDWDQFITPNLFDKLATEVADSIAHINWGEFIEDADFGGLAEAVDGAINDINWDSLITAGDFEGVASAIIEAIIDAINSNAGGNNPPPDNVPNVPGQPFSFPASGLADAINQASQRPSQRQTLDRAALREEAKRAMAERGTPSSRTSSSISTGSGPSTPNVTTNVSVTSPAATVVQDAIGGSVVNEIDGGSQGDPSDAVGGMLAAIGAALVRTNNRLLSLSGGGMVSSGSVSGGAVASTVPTPLIQTASSITNNFVLNQTVTPTVASKSATSFVGLRTLVGA